MAFYGVHIGLHADKFSNFILNGQNGLLKLAFKAVFKNKNVGSGSLLKIQSGDLF